VASFKLESVGGLIQLGVSGLFWKTCLSIIKEEEPESKPEQESVEDQDYPPLPEGTKLYVGNLPFDIDSEGLAKQFEPSRGLTPFPAKPCEGGMESSLDALENKQRRSLDILCRWRTHWKE
jgi:hypothetical protein